MKNGETQTARPASHGDDSAKIQKDSGTFEARLNQVRQIRRPVRGHNKSPGDCPGGCLHACPQTSVWVVKLQVKDYVGAAMMIVLNGEERSCQDDWTLADLVEDLGLTKKRIAAEVNRDIIPREAYAQQRLQADDVVEIVNFVGGG